MPDETETTVDTESVENSDTAAVETSETPTELATKLAALETTTTHDSDDAAEESTVSDDSDADESASTPPALVLPANHRRSLKANGWDDAEIDSNLAALGDKFLGLAARVHKQRNDETLHYANLGQKARQAAQQSQTQQVEQPAKPVGLPRVNVAALKEKYGEHQLIDELAGPVNAALERIEKFEPIIQQSQQRQQQMEIETLSKSIDSFFGGKELEPFKNVYGTPETVGSDQKQQESRNKVLEMAGNLIDGAKLQGRILTLNDALSLSHDAVSSGFKVQEAKAQITNALKKRESGITLKPSARGGRQNNAPVKTSRDLEKKVSAGLKKAFAST